MGGCKALYLHIPFCERKCPYCDFYSLPAGNGPDREALLDAYTDALCGSLALETAEKALASGPLATVYFGGGTPTVLGGRRLARVLDTVRTLYDIQADGEVTVECNPHSALAETLGALREVGVNRLSMGLQSASPGQLAAMGRLHGVEEAARAVEAAEKHGIRHISLDLMLALPGQTDRELEASVAFCAGLGVEHISAYLLKIEDGTPFARDRVDLRCPDEDEQARLYEVAVASLESKGYRQYEISNFCRDGLVARHNLTYWDCGEYLGLGPSAHSFVNGRRFYFPRDLSGFLEAADPFSLCIDDGPGGGVEEYCMLRLRLTEGILWSGLKKRYPGFDPEKLREKARPMEKGGLVVCDGDGLHLTVQGFLLSNAVIGTLLEDFYGDSAQK